MMVQLKRWLISAIVLPVFLIVIGCQSSTTVSPPNGVKETQSPEKKTAEEFMELAAQGKLKGIEAGIGATKKEIIKMYGNPKSIGNSERGLNLFYEGFSFEFQEYLDSLDQLKDEDKVLGIIADAKILGINATPAQLKVNYGSPSTEAYDDAHGTGWQMDYLAGERYLSFFAETNESAINTVYLR
ncbi:DUF4309 domain-containing protein [Brevibacillus antibioticus]|uniref:DUF4309 domain-containing protein n=2 Tax=Brevibacillus antibioticus TaxID=2570228 RepID=A0A4U2YAE7_9BACL|nr:DUF4309 domain-containing protein [Brevibacillus antibioticus]